MLIRLSLLIFIMGSGSVGHAASPSQYNLSVGAFSSVGSYGSDREAPDTNMQYLPISFKARTGAWTTRIQTSRVKISGPGNIGDGILYASSDQDTAIGLGDTLLGLDWRRIHGKWLIEPGVRLKFPTADKDKGLGTGSRDRSTQLAITGLFTQWRPFVIAGYKWRGYSEQVQLSNSSYLNAGVDWPYRQALSFGLGYDWRKPAVAGRPPGRESFAYGNWVLSKQWKVMLYAAKGFSDSSPDRTLGSQVSYSW